MWAPLCSDQSRCNPASIGRATRRRSLNFRIGLSYKLEAPKQLPDVRIYFGRRFENLLDAGVRTSIHDDATLLGRNRERDFAKFERACDLGDGLALERCPAQSPWLNPP